MKSILIVFFVTFFNSCSINNESNRSYPEVISVINEYSKLMKDEKGILLRGYGLHYAGQDKVYDGKIHTIDLAYSIDKNIKYDEGRELFYSIVNGLLKRINSVERLKEHFFHYPVGYEDLFISLSFDYSLKGFLKKNELDQITIYENKIMYHIIEEDVSRLKQKESISDVHILERTSSKTRAIVKNLPEADL